MVASVDFDMFIVTSAVPSCYFLEGINASGRPVQVTVSSLFMKSRHLTIIIWETSFLQSSTVQYVLQLVCYK